MARQRKLDWWEYDKITAREADREARRIQLVAVRTDGEIKPIQCVLERGCATAQDQADKWNRTAREFVDYHDSINTPTYFATFYYVA